jgi:site-specific recombinase XerD
MDKQESLAKFEQYLRRRFPERRTPIDYLSDVRQFMAACQKAWRDVTMHDMDAFVDQQRTSGLKRATVNRRVAALKTFFDFLAEESDDLSWPNPVRFKRHAGKRTRSLPRDLRDEDIEQVWRVIVSARDRAWFALMVRAGLRVGEVVGLQVNDVLGQPNGERPARLRVCGKGRKERTIWLTADAYAVLEAWLEQRPANGSQHVFLNERGQPLSANGIQWLLHGYGKQVGIDLTPHQLRHTFARQVTEAGMPVTSLGKLLGHAQITTTQIYTAGADPQLAQAYQTAMSHLERTAFPVPPPPTTVAPVASSAPPPSLPSSSAEIATPPEPKLPDWDAWERHLPDAIRQASLDYVKRRLHTWPARRRRVRTLSLLNELEHLWGWFLAHRPITHPGQLGLKDLWDYQTDQQAQGYAAGTINRRLDYIVGIARELAEREEPVDNSVFRLRYLPRPESLPRHLTEAESQRLETFLKAHLDSPDPAVRLENACLFVLLHSGLRAGECADLRFQDLDLTGKRLIVRQGKGQRDRLVYLSDVTCQAIRSYLQDHPQRQNNPLWLQRNGHPISPEWLRQHVAQVGQAAGIDHLFPHRLRHTCATRLLNAGMDITRIQKLLGHEMINTTMIYARVQDATVEADYRQALNQIERQQTPLSNEPIAVDYWPTQTVKVQETLDNSV